jgi:hypothetical protein
VYRFTQTSNVLLARPPVQPQYPPTPPTEREKERERERERKRETSRIKGKDLVEELASNPALKYLS